MTGSTTDSQTLSIYIPQDKLVDRPIERMQELAERRDRSLNHLVVEAILEYLESEEGETQYLQEARDAAATSEAMTLRSDAVGGVGDNRSRLSPHETESENTRSCSSPPEHQMSKRLSWGRRLADLFSSIWARIRRHLHDETPQRAEEAPLERTEALEEEVIEHKAIRFDVTVSGLPTAKVHASTYYLAPYREARIASVHGPRDISEAELDSVISEIVRIESPVTADRASRLCAQLGGLSRLSREVRDFYNEAIGRGADGGLFRCFSYSVDGDWTQRVLVAHGALDAVPRVIGPRQDLYEIPLPEVGAHIRRMRKRLTAGGTFNLSIAGFSEDELLRKVLKTYGILRLTKKARRYLDVAAKATLTENTSGPPIGTSVPF